MLDLFMQQHTQNIKVWVNANALMSVSQWDWVLPTVAGRAHIAPVDSLQCLNPRRLELGPPIFRPKLHHWYCQYQYCFFHNSAIPAVNTSKCIPALLYGLEACPLTKSDLQSLDFVINRFFIKLFQTSNMSIVKQCQEHFFVSLPSSLIAKRTEKFLAKLNNQYIYIKLEPVH